MRTIVFFVLGLLAASSGCGANETRDDQSGATAADDAGSTMSDAGTGAPDGRVTTASDGAEDVARLPPVPSASNVFVGGWDWRSGAAYPVRSFVLEHATAALVPRDGTTDLGLNPSYLAPGLEGAFLYAVNEQPGPRAGATVARIDLASGSLTPIQQLPYADGAFVHARVHPGGAYLFAADYYAGKLVVYRLGSDGKVGEVSASESFLPTSADESAQTHGVGIHDNGRFVYVPNKALDSIAQLTFDPASGLLTRGEDVPSPGGPRSIAVHGNVAYVLHEHASRLASFHIGDEGTLTPVADASTLPDDFAGENTGAHVMVHPSGTFVYASNRGHDSIAVFATTAEGMLTRVALTPTEGKTPRAFDIDPNGTLLVVANQGSDERDDGSLAVFAIGSDGLLTLRGAPLMGLKAPTTVVLVPRASAP